MEPFTIVIFMLVVISLAYLSKIVSVLVRVLFFALLAGFAYVLIAGISLNEVIDWFLNLILLVL